MTTRTYKRWTNEDRAFVSRHLPYSSRRTIAAAMNVTVGALDWTVRAYGLKENSEDQLVTEIKEHIANIRKELEK